MAVAPGPKNTEIIPPEWNDELMRRHPMTRPGHLLYTAKVEQEKLECFYKWCCCMCVSGAEMATRSYVDIYTNGVQTNAPCGTLCCIWCDNSSMVYWDDTRFTSWGAAGCCKPCSCWFCPHCFNICGEVFYLYKGCVCGCCPSAAPVGHCNFCGMWGCCCGCCLTSLLCGLKEGEGAVIEQVMNVARGGQANPPLRLQGPAAQMGFPIPQALQSATVAWTTPKGV